VVVTRGGQSSAAANVAVLDLQPAIYTSDGVNAVVVHNADYTLVTPQRPLVAGEFAFLHLRMREGLDERAFRARFGAGVEAVDLRWPPQLGQAGQVVVHLTDRAARVVLPCRDEQRGDETRLGSEEHHSLTEAQINSCRNDAGDAQDAAFATIQNVAGSWPKSPNSFCKCFVRDVTDFGKIKGPWLEVRSPHA